MHLIDLYNAREVNRIAEFAACAKQLDIDDLRDEYRELVRSAPRRHQRKKSYLKGRTGITGSGSRSNRQEEHLAVAIYNAYGADNPLTLPGGRSLTILDYQTPLKARRDDRGVGKVDLFGVLDGHVPSVIELKVSGSGNTTGDTPLRALLEGFAYCAIVEANCADIAGEAADMYGLRFSTLRPVLIVMAPEDYWMDYLSRPRAGNWYPAVRGLADRLGDAMTMEIYLLALMDAEFQMGLQGKPPRLKGALSIVSVEELAAAT